MRKEMLLRMKDGKVTKRPYGLSEETILKNLFRQTILTYWPLSVQWRT